MTMANDLPEAFVNGVLENHRKPQVKLERLFFRNLAAIVRKVLDGAELCHFMQLCSGTFFCRLFLYLERFHSQETKWYLVN